MFHRRVGQNATEPGRATELLQRGYVRRTTATEPRLSEIVAEYRRIGFDVQVIAHEPEPGACIACFEDAAGTAAAEYCDVYVRSAATPAGAGTLA
ncbi:MAG: hypothetical protein U1E89_09975 [Burkholderiaceae bacterium]